MNGAVLFGTQRAGWRFSTLPLALVVCATASCESKPATDAPPGEPAPASVPGHAASGASKRVPAPAASASLGEPSKWSFDDTPVGWLPKGWSVLAGEWSVGKGQVFSQSAVNASPVFNVALLNQKQWSDLDISVRVRAREGRIDQGGGVVWRARDAKNYYVARYNPLEDNYRVYFVEQGRRRQLASADVEVDHQAWHTVRVKMVGDHIQCFLDGKQELGVSDATFKEPGRVGLWTKADAVSDFDDLTVSEAGSGAP